VTRPLLRPAGVLIAPDFVREEDLANRRSLNVALLGALSHHLAIPEAAFLEAVRDELTFTAEDLGLGPIFVLDLEGVIAVSTASAGSRPTGC